MRSHRTGAFVLAAIFVGLIAGAFIVHGALSQAGNASPPIHIDPTRLYRVSHVIDGDTFVVDIDGRKATVRILGVNTPETVDPRKPPECYGKEASDTAKELLDGRSVILKLNPDREARDKYGRYLLYVYRDDGLYVNEYLLEHGYAREYTVGKPYDMQAEFRKIEEKAKDDRVGLWAKCAES